MARLLFLDDDNLTLQLMGKIATRIGHEAITCDSVQDARRALQEHHPDILLIDLSLKEMSGLSFIRELREIPEFTRTPMVVVSAGSTLQDESDALAAGASGYILKPVGPDALLGIIKKYTQPKN
jgi:DNA-binding response OmpR family regulator